VGEGGRTDAPKIPSRGPAHKPSAAGPTAPPPATPSTPPPRWGRRADADAPRVVADIERGRSRRFAVPSLWRSVAAVT